MGPLREPPIGDAISAHLRGDLRSAHYQPERDTRKVTCAQLVGTIGGALQLVGIGLALWEVAEPHWMEGRTPS